MNAAISISYCSDHRKGGDTGDCILPGHLHARMLRDTVDWILQDITATDHYFLPLICATAFPGITNVETSAANPERDYIWQVFKKARFVTMPQNPGHQCGANWAIRMGIEAAAKLGYDYLIHTAEDVVPFPGALFRMVDQMHREGADYIGERWGINDDELNAQFFGCRLSWIAGIFDGAGMHGRWTERYLADLVYGNNRKSSFVERLYWHTHDPEEHQRLIERARST